MKGLISALSTVSQVSRQIGIASRDLKAIAKGPRATAQRFLIRKPAWRLIGRMARKGRL